MGAGGSMGIGGSMDLSLSARKQSGLSMVDNIGLGATGKGGFSGKIINS